MPNQFLSDEFGDIEDYFVTDYRLIDNFVGDTLWVWGAGFAGRLGNNVDSPGGSGGVPITTFAGGTTWKQVSMVNESGSAIKTDGTLWTWGYNGLGQLGTNNTTTSLTPVTTFAGQTTWKQVAQGYRHTVAIKTDGSLWIWGVNNNGQLGINNTDTKSTPVTTFAGGNNWKSIAADSGTTSAIKTDGTLWGWGSLTGSPDTSSRRTPVTTFAGGNDWKQVSTGYNIKAAIKTDGSLWIWGGRNAEGQLGTNDVAARATPVTTFAGGNNWKQVACGYRHMAAIKTDGSLWTWGHNYQGGLGDNTTTNRSTPVTTFAGGNNWKSVACGKGSTAAIKTDGSLWTWGRGNFSSLGAGNGVAGRSTPVTTFAGGTNWKQVTINDTTAGAIRTNETTTTDVSISTPILNTTYYNIVATSNGTTLKLYQNNSLLTTANLNGTLTSTTLFYTISDIMNSFAGNLSNIQVYNKELSTAEIAQNYNALKGRYGLT